MSSEDSSNPDGNGTDADVPEQPREGCLTRLTPVTVPGCASCLTSMFLVMTVVIAGIIFFMDPDHVPWEHTVGWFRIAIIIALVIAIPMLVGRLIRLWMEGESSRFPDMDYAWNAGLFALGTNGLSIRSIPIYLILGTKSEQQERAIFAGANLGMRVEGVPEGPAPIHWYANPDGIYICCSDSSWSSALASLREELLLEAAGKNEESPFQRTSSSDIRPAPSPAANPTPAASPDLDPMGGTLMLENFVIPESQPEHETITPASSAHPGADTVSESEFDSMSEMDDSEAPGIEPVILSPQYASASLQELQYLGQLLRRNREPACAVNGIVSMLQLEAIHGSTDEMEELRKAVHGDLEAIHYATQVYSPVTTLIVGLEQERGFRELIRRVGKEKASVQRFGKKFDVQVIPESTSLSDLSAHVCGAFEDWCYFLFREEKSLVHTRNTRLYELLAKVRLGWKGRLAEFLSQTIGRGDSASEEPFLFSGCYVAATGSTPDKQGFVKGFLEKLKDEQEFVQWTDDATKADSWRRRFAGLGMIAVVGLFASLIGMIVYSWWA